MIKLLFVLLVLLVVPANLPSQAIDCGVFEPVSGEDVAFEVVARGLAGALNVKAPPGDVDRIFVATQGGTIRIVLVPEDSVVAAPFLDISRRVTAGGERGLLGFAFHPQYDQNGYFFVNYSRLAPATGWATPITPTTAAMPWPCRPRARPACSRPRS